MQTADGARIPQPDHTLGAQGNDIRDVALEGFGQIKRVGDACDLKEPLKDTGFSLTQSAEPEAAACAHIATAEPRTGGFLWANGHAGFSGRRARSRTPHVRCWSRRVGLEGRRVGLRGRRVRCGSWRVRSLSPRVGLQTPHAGCRSRHVRSLSPRAAFQGRRLGSATPRARFQNRRMRVAGTPQLVIPAKARTRRLLAPLSRLWFHRGAGFRRDDRLEGEGGKQRADAGSRPRKKGCGFPQPFWFASGADQNL
ncbi:hypothetical protein DT603_02140 [Pseudoxanthomonas gei]|uniref:Uncharacterized protein n=1 Tax=Pseudoxanthomonas gei TaxID=1383030 RepID=A0ABX0AAQ0_9GAMM|nr:hypothetical protein [Pseudoxanthomonas gei]